MSTNGKPGAGNFIALIVDGQIVGAAHGNKNANHLRQALESARAEGKKALLGKVCADGRVRFLSTACNSWSADSDISKPNASRASQTILEAANVLGGDR